MALCNLSDVKTMLNIPLTDTTSDDKLALYIKQVSSQIESYIGYKLKRAEYTEELQAVNCRQVINLNHFPIQSVASVTANGEAVTDYKILPKYARFGGLYRGDGWTGTLYTQGFTHDVISGAWEIAVTYTAGYYLPGDEGYTEGAEDSLPYDISAACCQMVCLRYMYDAQGATGLKAHTEGGISDTYGDSANEAGLTDSVKRALSKYVFYGVA